jgi:hypothetical protein
MGKNNMNKELRLKFNPESYDVLVVKRNDLISKFGKADWSMAMNALCDDFTSMMMERFAIQKKYDEIVQEHEDLMRRWLAAELPLEQNPHVRESVDLNIKEKNIKKESGAPKKRGLHLLPKDFAPPRSIASEAGIDYQGALECFTDWANSKGKKYKDWTATFRGACRSWLKERYPHLRRTPIHPHGNTEILRDEDMNDTRPSLV